VRTSGEFLERETCADGTAINLGTMERIAVLDGAKMVCDFTKHKAEIKKRPDMPTGPLNRVADNALAKRLLGWEPKAAFREGGSARSFGTTRPGARRRAANLWAIAHRALTRRNFLAPRRFPQYCEGAARGICRCVLGAGPQTDNSRGHRP
jgi:hypothetical protein